ncbi:MAG TPA: DMT family transporter [Candidatus Udaeobacter sp.]|nr:DMT family transporter [Candidatus Udaeobacter sp.]
MMGERESGWLPVVTALAVVGLWGATPVVTKLAAREIEPLLIGLYRALLGGLVAAPLAALLRITLPRGRQLPPFLISAFCGFIGFPVIFAFGQRMTSAMHGGLILAVLPIFTGLIAAAVERRALPARWWLGSLVAFAGEALLIAGRSQAVQAGTSLPGDMLVLLASLVASAGYVAGARLSQARYASLGTTLWGISVAAIAGALLLAPAGGLPPPAASLESWAAIGFLAWFTSIVGYIGWYWALARGGIARMGTLQFLQPLSGLVLAFLMLGERPTLILGLATGMILSGVLIARSR